MIISVSRRTDIAAYYSKWFMNRIKDGYCLVPNPMNPNQISKVSLELKDVDNFVFWTKWPVPLIQHFKELDQRGYKYYFQYTLNKYPKELEPRIPSCEKRLEAFQELATLTSPAHVVWRYDPIIISNRTPVSYHIDNFQSLSESLKGYTERVMFSFQIYSYQKVEKRLLPLEQDGWKFDREFANEQEQIHRLLTKLKKSANDADIEMFSCAMPQDLSNLGIRQGSCIDGDLIESLFQISVDKKKDAGQRKVCGCVNSRDIGVYHTCLAGCPYCYATHDQELAEKRRKEHDPDSPALWLSPGKGK